MRRFLPFLALLLIPIAAVAYVVASGLGDDDADGSGSANPTPNPAGNLIADGGFEDTDAPCTQEEGAVIPCWFSLREPEWQLSSEKSYTGDRSALLAMREDADSDETKIYYLVQELALNPNEEIPEIISGNYFVENWLPGTKNQYLQFVVIFWGDDFSNMPECPDGPCPNYQIRYLLAGIEEDPFPIANARFVYVDSADPVEGQWVHFERNLREDFEAFWGAVPENVTRVRLLFEVRYDDKLPDEGPLEADVYYDDLYLGPAESAP